MTETDSPIIYLQIAIAVPLNRLFDYLPVENEEPPQPGCRVRVSFGYRTVTAIVVAHSNHTDCPASTLKEIDSVIDDQPLWPAEFLAFLLKIGRYYHHSPGETLSTALPVSLRGQTQRIPRGQTWWKLTEHGRELSEDYFKRAKAKRALWETLKQDCRDTESLKSIAKSAASILPALRKQGVVASFSQLTIPTPSPASNGPKLNQEQLNAVHNIELNGHTSYVLHGVTGSGKTEVYIHLMLKVLEQNKQILVLVPEISLTPQLLKRLSSRLGVAVASLHSELADGQRHKIWYQSSTGDYRVLVGTRSAVFTPLPELGLIIVDEEHDDSFKQQEGLRYHGRAIAIWRAQTEDIPIVLGSATPSLNLLYNTEQRHFPVLHLTQRAGGAQPPKINLVDLRHNTITEGLAEVSWKALSQALEAGNQALVFVNRRGYAPVLICKHCGWQAPCPNCDSLATVHKNDQQLRCHHCGWKEPQPQRCKQCGSQHLEVLGQGTQRVEAALQQRLNYPVIRVDRDVVNKRQQHELIMHQMHKGEPCVLVGTQMLAKGHDFPDLTLVVIVNLDQGLFSADFRAPERLAQLVEQVAGRAGRAQKSGQVLIQTYLPEDPFYQTLIHQGYDKLSQDLLNARKEAELPPYTFMALVRAASKKDRAAFDFLKEMSDAVINNHPHVTLEGPASSMLTRRAGKYRAYLQLSATNRKALHLCLDALQQSGETLRFNGSWSIDVDPAEMG